MRLKGPVLHVSCRPECMLRCVAIRALSGSEGPLRTVNHAMARKAGLHSWPQKTAGCMRGRGVTRIARGEQVGTVIEDEAGAIARTGSRVAWRAVLGNDITL